MNVFLHICFFLGFYFNFAKITSTYLFASTRRIDKFKNPTIFVRVKTQKLKFYSFNVVAQSAVSHGFRVSGAHALNKEVFSFFLDFFVKKRLKNTKKGLLFLGYAAY